MEESALKQPDLVGRDAELKRLRQSLDSAIAGKGSTILISGEAGIGKTRLIDAFKNTVSACDIDLLAGAADEYSTRPFLVLSKALGAVIDKPLFEEQELTRFLKIFVFDRAGILVAQASSEDEDMDAEIFAGMLSAVQNFVRDSFEQEGGGKANLGRLEYGDMKILTEHGEHLFLTTVFRGGEHADMRSAMRRTLQKIGQANPAVPENRTGKTEELATVQEEIGKLAGMGFFVRRDLEGVKLENERIRIADEILEALKQLSAEKPLVIVMEDLHWADESSLFVINYLGRNIKEAPVLLLGTLRPGESDALQIVIENMRNEEIVDEMALEKLDVENTASIINRTFSPNDFPVTLANQLYEQSKGNPLFVVEMLRRMHDDGSIAKLDGKYSLVSESYQIPTTVEEVINSRLESLDPDSMAMIEYASCIGQRFEAHLVTSNRMMKDPNASLDKLLASGILLKKNGTLEFSHAIFQNVIYNSIGERWKIGHHKNLGEYLERAYAGRPDEVMYDLARHFSRTKEHKKCTDYCIRAGEMAENSFAVEQALGFYRKASTALSGLDASNTRERSVDILERIGDILTLIGNYDESIESYTAAKAGTDQKELMARMMRKIGTTYEKKGEYDKSLEVLANAKEVAEEGTAEYGRICRSESTVCDRTGDYDKGLALSNTALKFFEESGAEKKDIGDTLRIIGNIHASKGEFDTALQYYEKSLPIMEEIGEQYGCAAALNNIGTLYSVKGDPVNELEYYERSLEILEKIGFKLGIATLLSNIGNVNYTKGDLAKALEYYTRSLKIRETIGDQQGMAISLNNIGFVQHDSGKLASALEFYERSLKMCLKIGEKYISIHTHCGIADTQIGLKNVQTALENAGKAIEIAAEIGAKAEEGMGHRVLGKAHIAVGNFDKAEEEFEKAKTIFEAAGDKIELAVLSYELAFLFKARADPAKAEEQLKNALSEFERMGMALWIGKCKTALNGL